jgi:hypothetical protein
MGCEMLVVAGAHRRERPMRKRADDARGGRRWHRRRAAVAVVAGLVGLAACTVGGAAEPASSPSIGRAGGSAAGTGAGGHLVLDYRPSQATGWSAPYSPTIGGHVAAKTFTRRGQAYQLSLLSFGQSVTAPNPVYEKSPADPVVRFARTLAASWGRFYAFRYRHGLPAGARFSVQSYSVKVGGGSGTDSYGNDLYLVYQPGRQDQLSVGSDLQFIQVVWSRGGSVVDSTTANPFYGSGSGLTSVYGNQSVSFYDNPHLSQGSASRLRPVQFRAEVFLAQDTGTKNAEGKDIVNIFGGVRWGWQLHSQP